MAWSHAPLSVHTTVSSTRHGRPLRELSRLHDLSAAAPTPAFSAAPRLQFLHTRVCFLWCHDEISARHGEEAWSGEATLRCGLRLAEGGEEGAAFPIIPRHGSICSRLRLALHRAHRHRRRLVADPEPVAPQSGNFSKLWTVYCTIRRNPVVEFLFTVVYWVCFL
jgi:hypothetical protein